MRLTVVICIMFIVLSAALMGGKVEDTTSVPEETTVVQMQQEILTMWHTWYEDQDKWTKNWLKEDKETWPMLAEELAKSVKKYQNTPVKVYEWKDKYITLPVGKEAHLVVASMATYETKVRNGEVGKLGEIGIIQCHPKWCLVRNPELKALPIKKRKEVAREAPHLNLDAAVKHLTVSYGICNKRVRNLNDWTYTVAHYGAGNLAIEKGRCQDRDFAKARIFRMKKYKRKIKQSLQNI